MHLFIGNTLCLSLSLSIYIYIYIYVHKFWLPISILLTPAHYPPNTTLPQFHPFTILVYLTVHHLWKQMIF